MRSTITRAGQGMQLNLAPLIAPHRKHGRISIRVERLPQQARFSRGNRNSNGSWSLASDELDDLFYSVPDGTPDHTLAIRIVNLTGGNTLAVIDLPITSVAETEGEAEAQDEATSAPSGETDELVQTLRQQLAQMKATLTARESELAEARKAASRAAATPARDADAELDAVRAELQAEFDERLAAVGAQSAADLKRQRESWASDMNTRLAALAAKTQQQLNDAGEIAEREKQHALEEAKAAWQREESERLAKAKADWRAETDKSLADASHKHDKNREGDLEALRTKLRQEAQDALRAEEQTWKAAEAARLAAAEKEWQAKAEKQVAETRTQLASAQGKDAEKALSDLRAELESKAKAALAKAEQEWQAEETERFSTAKAEWQTALEKAVKEERAVANAGEKNSDTALRDLRDELTKTRSTLSERDTALADLRKAGERAAREAKDNLAAAEAKWKKDEAARLETERAKWRSETDEAIAKARADVAAASAKGTDAAQDELRQQLSALNTKLGEKETALTAARSKIEELRQEKEAAAKAPPPPPPATDDNRAQALQDSINALEQRLEESEAALTEARDIIEQQRQASKAKPQRNRKSEDAGEEQRWQAITNELAEARSRYEAAELALAQVRMRAKDEGRIHQDLTSTRGALAAREKELADLRAKFAPLDGQEVEGAEATAATPPATETAPRPQYSKKFIAGVGGAAVLFALAIVFYPTIYATLFPPARLVPPAAPEVKEVARLEPVAVEVKALMLRDAKLRVDPSSSAKAVATVTKGFEVVVLETKAKWTLVRMGSDAKAQQGWVLSTALDEITPPEDEPAAPSGKPK